MRLHIRIVRFLALSAWDLLLPDIIAKPLNLARNFYTCFLASSPADKLELLREARSLNSGQIDELIDALSAEWKTFLPGGKLGDAQRTLLRQMVEGLHSAGQSAATNPAEVLRESLNRSILARSTPLSAVQLRPEQQAVGRSVLQAALTGQVTPRGPRPLPPNAPSVPGYTLQHVLGDGGFSVVYLATHQASGERRAVKVGALDDLARFQREVQLLERLAGPHVVRYHEHGQLAGQFWISMEYLGELTLADLIRTRPTPEQALLLGDQVLRGLDNLHSAGVIHRDLKPENAMVDAAFRLRLIDFGLARPLPGSTGTTQTVSVTKGLIGTPRYLSPEQIRDQPATPASDVWSFGCILFELLSGQPLFESNNMMALGHEIMTREIALDRAEIPAEIRPFLDRCLRRQANERWGTAHEALAEFDRVGSTARRRLRHERYRDGWGRVLERKLLERFVAGLQGQMQPEAAARFTELARQEGIAEIDEERLLEILEPICAGQRRILQAQEVFVQTRQQLQQAMTSLSASDLARRVEHLAELEKGPALRQHELRKTIEGLLVEELRSWQEKNQRETEADKQRQEADRRRREEEQARRRQQEEQERHAREQADWRRAHESGSRSVEGYQTFLQKWPSGTYSSQATLERERLKEAGEKQRRKRTHYLGLIGGGVVVGGAALGGLGALLGAVGWSTIVFPLIGFVVGAVAGAVGGALLGAFHSSWASGHSTCCDGYRWGPVDENVVKGFAIVCAILGGLGGIAVAINTLLEETYKSSIWEWTTGQGAIWGGLAGVLLGLIGGLIIAVKNDRG